MRVEDTSFSSGRLGELIAKQNNRQFETRCKERSIVIESPTAVLTNGPSSVIFDRVRPTSYDSPCRFIHRAYPHRSGTARVDGVCAEKKCPATGICGPLRETAARTTGVSSGGGGGGGGSQRRYARGHRLVGGTDEFVFPFARSPPRESQVRACVSSLPAARARCETRGAFPRPRPRGSPSALAGRQ
ncbi:hypothetical protein PUN28_002373 [Cardiocondyla obscurior]|uniref:Uncharacterized protein n=1 Tax=Cardiocondyla obscurior TaxID=286306 RepID=A0AAW2GTT0_9HYME